LMPAIRAAFLDALASSMNREAKRSVVVFSFFIMLRKGGPELGYVAPFKQHHAYGFIGVEIYLSLFWTLKFFL